MVNEWRQVQDKEHHDDSGTGTYFLKLARVMHREENDLNFVFDDHFHGFIAVRATHGE